MSTYKIGTQVGIFKLDGELSSRGGQGLVYAATIENDTKFPSRNGKRVALKFARTEGKHKVTYNEILVEEIDILARLRHPGIVRVMMIDNREATMIARNLEGHPRYFAMEYLEGGDLKDFIDKEVGRNPSQSRFPLAWRVELIYQIAQTLAYIHASRLAHQDMKPENIVFRKKPNPNEAPEPVFIDFGLAKERQMEREQALIRTQRDNALSPMYTSCERFQQMNTASVTGDAFNFRAHDIWAFGAIAYEILNGRHIYSKQLHRNSTPDEIIDCVCNKKPDEMDSSITFPLLKELILATLLHNPQRRPKMNEVVFYLDSAIELIAPRI